MPPQPECVHEVDFDKFEIVHLPKHKHMIRVSCSKCHTAVTLDDVLGSLSRKAYNLNERLLKYEPPTEATDVEPVPDSGS